MLIIDTYENVFKLKLMKQGLERLFYTKSNKRRDFLVFPISYVLSLCFLIKFRH